MTDLIESATRHAVFLERLKAGEVKKATPVFLAMWKEIRRKLIDDDISSLSRAKMERLLKELSATLIVILGGYTTAIATELLEIGVYEAGFQARALENFLDEKLNALPPEKLDKLPEIKQLKRVGVKVAIETVIPTANQVKAAIDIIPLSVKGVDAGKLVLDIVEDFTPNETEKIINTIRQGYFEGEPTQTIVRRIAGNSKLNDGALAITKRNAETVVRTAIAHASSVAREETYNQNADLVEKYEIVATLDSKTSVTCRYYDGKKFIVGKGPRPPLHPRCRSTTVPVLSKEFDFLDEGATRSSIDGYVPATMTYYDWLKTQSAAMQEAALGKKMALLFQKGGLTSERFSKLSLDRNFMPASLKEMRKLEPLAFQKAGI